MDKVGGRKQLTARFMKAMGIFGSIEILRMACTVVRTKLVALWIGSAGVGIITLYNSTLDVVRSIGMLNLRQSSVPAIASAAEADRAHLCRAVETFGLILGVAMMIGVAALSPLLSLITFGSYDYSWGFAILAPTLLATALADSRQAVFQGLGRLKVLAKSSLYAVVASTLLAIPLFYFFRMAAIIPVLVIFPLFTMLFVYLLPDARIKHPSYNRELFHSTVRSLVKLGSYLTIGIGVGVLAEYLLRIYLSHEGGSSAVGLFQAGFVIVKTYVGLFFTAITMEFFPRLSATIRRRRYTEVVVSHEISMAIGLLLPVIVIFISAGDWVVRLLYSSAFTAIEPYMEIAIIGTLLRAISWCYSYVIIAKGDGRLYVLTETVSAAALLTFSYFGWQWNGYEGLGWAYVCQFAVYTAVVMAVCFVRYGIGMKRSTAVLSFITLGVSFAALALRHSDGRWASLTMLLPAACIMYALFRVRGAVRTRRK